jgi:2'-5' RNA ligase
MNVLREFIAISLTPEIHHNLEQVLSIMKQRLPKSPIRWVPVQNIHLTLKFLGDVSLSQQELLTNMLKSEVHRHKSFELSFGELGVFPSLSRPRVIWVGSEAPAELFSLQKGIEAEMAKLGYSPEERPFSPHLTLGRMQRNVSAQDIRRVSEILGAVKVGFLGAMRVNDVHLYRSDLQPSGAIYTRLFTAALFSMK